MTGMTRIGSAFHRVFIARALPLERCPAGAPAIAMDYGRRDSAAT
jgi:hypothetical protein